MFQAEVERLGSSEVPARLKIDDPVLIKLRKLLARAIGRGVVDENNFIRKIFRIFKDTVKGIFCEIKRIIVDHDDRYVHAFLPSVKNFAFGDLL